MPVKRSEALQPLSRQHHNGLLFCLVLNKGIAKAASLKVMKDFCLHFLQQDLSHHFMLEEAHLHVLPLSFPSLKNGIERMMNEHAVLRQLFANIEENASYDLMKQLAVTLEKHIRFEERELFNNIDMVLDANTFKTLQSVLQEEKDDNCMNYPIKFWL
jgi:hypothetical protein